MRWLVVPQYSEPLKAVLALVSASVERGHEAVVLPIANVAGDEPRIEALLAEHGLPCPLVPPKSPIGAEDRALLERLGTHEVLKSARVAVQRASDARWAEATLDRIAPDAVLVLNEHLPLCRHLVAEANRRGIPTAMYQWGIGNASVRHTLEMAARSRFGRRFAEVSLEEVIDAERPRALKVDQASLSSAPLDERERDRVRSLLSSHGLLPEVPTAFWGCGHAKYAAAIGRGSAEVFAALGRDRTTIGVVGSSVYEPLIARRERVSDPAHRERCRRGLGLPAGSPLILWATNDQTTYWEPVHGRETMESAWMAVRDAILRATPDARIVLKVHPKEPADQYRCVSEGEPRVLVLAEGDVWSLLEGVDACLTRFSSVAFSACCLGVPALSVNFPAVPGGTLYDDIGGTLHANSAAALEGHVAGLADGSLRERAIERGRAMIDRFVSVEARPAAERLCDFLEQITAGDGPVDAGQERSAGLASGGIAEDEPPSRLAIVS